MLKVNKHGLVGIVILGLLSVVMTGCLAGSSQETRLLWSGTSGTNKMAYQYVDFTGTENGKARVEAEETLVLAYAATIDKGTLTIQVRAPSKETVWETTLSESIDEQQVELVAPESGTYAILVIGQDAAGDFDVSWLVR